jgi:hypothetical protein
MQKQTLPFYLEVSKSKPCNDYCISLQITLVMKFLTACLVFIGVASACGDNAYRCVNPDGFVTDDWAKTKACCNKIAEEYCYCSHRAEEYCDPFGSNIQKFKDCCESYKGFEWREC